MQSTKIRIGPAALSTAAANIANCGITSLAGPVGYTQKQPYLIVRHIRIVNKVASQQTFTLYIGATGSSAAGTEFMGAGGAVGANSFAEWYGELKLLDADFLTGISSSANALIFEAEGEIAIQN